MTSPQTNSMAAVLSFLLRVVFWIAVIAGTVLMVFLSLGLIGSLNEGEVSLPGAKFAANGVPVGQLVAALVGAILSFSGVVYVCYQLRDILATLADGDPFVPENAPRLMHIALAMGALEVARIVALFIVNSTLDMGEKIGGEGEYAASLMPNWALWGAVVVLLILAQVFKEGSRLREEKKMTI